MTGVSVPTMRVYDVGDVLPDDYRETLQHYLLHHPEVIVFKSFRDEMRRVVTDYLELAPTPIAQLRLAQFYGDEIRHGWYFYNVYRTLGLTRAGFDHYMSAEALELAKVTTWAEFAMLNLLADRVGAFHIGDWIGCSYRPLARVAERVAFDEWGHAHMGYFHVRELLADEPERLEEVQGVLNHFWPLALDMFGSSTSKSQHRYIEVGLRTKTNEELRQNYIQHVKPLLTGLGLTTPPDDQHRHFL